VSINNRPYNGVIYRKFSDIPREIISKGYEIDEMSEYFLNKCKVYAKMRSQEEDIIKLITLVNTFSFKGQLNVLDYGGGVGQMFFAVKKYLTFPDSVIWNVLDVEGVIKTAKKRIKKESNLFFYSNLADIKKIDFLFFRQSFQLLDNYKGILRNIVSFYRPKTIFISGITAGENIDYITLVFLEENKGLPCRFFNEKELVNFIAGLEYCLVDRYEENERKRADLSYLDDDKYHLDSKRNNYVKTYIFRRKNNE
jgi:putative methyltransferase (TIGR04325 family)